MFSALGAWLLLICFSLDASDAWADFRKGVEAYRRGDDATALQEFWSLAQQDHPGAEYNLGVLYANGRGVLRNVKHAAYWYRRAADKGHPFAQCNLGALYEQGDGVEQNDTEAVKWYRLSAERGNAGGQNNLARMYEHGRGVPPDQTLAVFWYRAAADQGDVHAQANLARMYYEGTGVKQDHVAALMWWTLSAARGSGAAAIMRDHLTARMSPRDLAEAQRLTRGWSPKKP